MKNKYLSILILVVGILIGSLAQSYFSAMESLKNLYIDSSLNVAHYISIIDALNKDDDKLALKLAEMYLRTSQVILEGCDQDVCKKDSPDIQMINKGISAARKYEYKSCNLGG